MVQTPGNNETQPSPESFPRTFRRPEIASGGKEFVWSGFPIRRLGIHGVTPPA